MNRILEKMAKKELTPLKLEHVLLFLFGISLVAFGDQHYEAMNSVHQVIVLIIYLSLLVGVAPIQMPVFKSNFWQLMFAGFFSGILDSFVVLKQCKDLRTLEPHQDPDAIMKQENNQETEGTRAKLLALFMVAALVGGLVIWFGEVYAAGVYKKDNRTGILSALYIFPPVFLFLTILGIHAQSLKIKVVRNLHAQSQGKGSTRDVVEFAVGIILLLFTHNPVVCLGVLLAYAVLTRQDGHLLDVWKDHTEVDVMLILLIALTAGAWLVTSVVGPLGCADGEFAPIVPAGIQAVLWGPLYDDSSVHLWMRITTLSTGALLAPISSLVGVMLFKSGRQWLMYMRYSVPYAVLWYAIMRGWMWLVPPDSAYGQLLEQWAIVGGQ